jgi:hypothetical protein
MRTGCHQRLMTKLNNENPKLGENIKSELQYHQHNECSGKMPYLWQLSELLKEWTRW